MIDYDDSLVLIALNRLLSYKPIVLREILDSTNKPSELILLLEKLSYNNNDFPFKRLIKESERDLDWYNTNSIKILWTQDPQFPSLLKETPDSPGVLFVKGDIHFKDRVSISIVGTRNSTNYGKQFIKELLKDLSKCGHNPIIISGLAFGTDIEVHKAALDNSLQTIAVLPSGIDKIYPGAHYSISKEIQKSGALISDFPLNTRTIKYNFLKRNRIIAGVSNATIIIESDVKGGAMITASLTNGYSRDLFALPGRITDRFSAGCNMLIAQNKALLISSYRELLSTLGLEDKSKLIDPELDFDTTTNSAEEKIIVTLRNFGEMTLDELTLATGYNPAYIALPLLNLEMSERIVRNNSGTISLIR